jgi:hypothetical protein
MVEADSHLKLLPTSLSDIYKVIEHIDMQSMGVQYQPYTVIPTLLGSDFGVLGHLWSQNNVIMSWLRLTATSNCFPDPYWTYKKYLSTLMFSPSAYSSCLTKFYPPYLAQIGGTWSLVESKWCIFVMVDADSHLKLLPTSILDTYKVIEYIDMLSKGMQYHPYTVISTLLGSDFGVLGHLWSQNDVIMSWLMLTATSNCFPHPY